MPCKLRHSASACKAGQILVVQRWPGTPALQHSRDRTMRIMQGLASPLRRSSGLAPLPSKRDSIGEGPGLQQATSLEAILPGSRHARHPIDIEFCMHLLIKGCR